MIYVIVINGKSFGINEGDVAFNRDVHRVHRLPMSTPVMAGVASIEGERVNLFDLSACLGYPPSDDGKGGTALFLTGEDGDYAYLVREGLSAEPLQPESTHPLPDHLATEVIGDCAIVSGKPVPLISLPALFNRLMGGFLDPPTPVFPESPGKEPSVPDLNQQDMMLLGIAGGAFAIPCGAAGEKTFPLPELAEIPMAPSQVSGIAWLDGNICTVLDSTVKLGMKSGGGQKQVLPLSERSFALLTEGIRGKVDSGGFTAVRAPAPFRSPLTPWVITVKDIPIPVLEPEALAVHGVGEYAHVSYETRSDFRQQFRKRKVILHIAEVNGQRYGLPTSLVEGVLDLLPIRELPGSRPVAVGASVVKGSVLPVLDLERCFGGRSKPASGWRMVHLKDGTFEALFLAESVLTDIVVPVEKQLDLPPELDGRYISGCFLEEEDLRLILDVPSFVIHITRETMSDAKLGLAVKPREVKTAAPKVEAGEPLQIYPVQMAETKPEPQASPPEEHYCAVTDAGEDETVPDSVPVDEFGQSEGPGQPRARDNQVKYSPPGEEGDTPETESEIQYQESPVGRGEGADFSKPVRGAGFDAPDRTGSGRESEYGLQPEEPVPREKDDEASGVPEKATGSTPADGSADPALGGTVSLGTGSIEIPSFKRCDSSLERDVAVGEIGPRDARPAGLPPKKDGRSRGLFILAAVSLAVVLALFFHEDIRTWLAGSGIQGQFGMSGVEGTGYVEEESSRQENLTASQAQGAGNGEDVSSPLQNVTEGSDLLEEKGELEQVPETEDGGGETADEVIRADLIMKLTPGDETVFVKKGPAGLDGGKIARFRTHIVKKGDTLWDIARFYTGNPFRYPILAEASDIRDPDLIYPGQRIFIVLDRGE